MNNALKRWLIIGLFLLASLWLAWTAPEIDDSDLGVVNSVRTAKPIYKSGKIETVENQFLLIPRVVATKKPVDIFATQTKAIKVVKTRPTLVKVKSKPIKPRKPTAPRLPFKYIGKLIEKNKTKIFLMQGQALHIVVEGDKIDSNYQLKQVDESEISIIYLPLKLTQTMDIGK